MRKLSAAIAVTVCLFTFGKPLHAAPCNGSTVASGINLTMGTPVKLQVVAQAGCVNQPPGTLTVGGTAPGSIMTVTPDTTWNDFKFAPTAIGNATVTFAAPGFTTLSVPVVVAPGILDLVPGN